MPTADDVRRPAWLFGIAIGVQLSIIGGLLVYHLYVGAFGSTVLLKVAPVDPRDPLRGDYLTFTYDISRIPTSQLSVGGLREGEMVWVPLAKNGSTWEVLGPVTEERSANEDTGADATIRGTVTSISPDTVSVLYGIEEYFIPEGSGERFPVGSESVTAEVSIAEDGRGQLKKVYVDGRPFP